MAVLYHEILNCTVPGLADNEKDKFLLSKGHAALALYAAMNQVGLLTDDQICTYQQDGSYLSELLEVNDELGFETSGGSLGINLSYAVGLALLGKKKEYSYKVFVEVGDGEIDKGNVWEAIMAASQFKLDNLIMIIDANTIQADGKTQDIMSWVNFEERLLSFGWNVLSIDGYNCMELIDAFMNHHKKDVPLAIIANTVKGKGVSFMENDYRWHDCILKENELDLARNEVNTNVDDEF